MEEILEKFETTFNETKEDELSHKDLYKNWGRYGNQEERRAEILRQQKSKRENKLDNCRGILNLMECAEEKTSVFKKSPQGRYQPSVYVPGFTNSAHYYYNNVLMHSEWMVEKPEDFNSNWFVAPCPKGTRTLVVACNGMTNFYSKYGKLIQTTSSLLPGGNSSEKWKNCSVLDGFYCKDTSTMYILDVLSWKNHVMADGEMEFRRYWLETTFREQPQLETVTKKNKVSFKLLPMTPCDNDSLQEFMMTHPPLKSAKLDGLLFYHKHGHYIAGETPLVLWLYPYMVPEIISSDIKIHTIYAAEKPHDYVNQATFIQIFEEKNSKKKTPFKRGKRKSHSASETSMDAEDGLVGQGDTVKDDITEHNINKVAIEQNTLGEDITENNIANDTGKEALAQETMENDNIIESSPNGTEKDRDTTSMETEMGVNETENTASEVLLSSIYNGHKQKSNKNPKQKPAAITK